MGTMLEDINHLSREIGPRPAGTEEERVAAMYIAENIQKRSGLSFKIEDFDGARGRNKVFNIISIISAILFFLAILLPIISVPIFIISLVLAVIAVLEYFDRPILSNFLRYGISQNVVAKYTPTFDAEKQQAIRKRKVVFVSHYDSGKAVSGSGDTYFKVSKISRFASIVVCCIIPLFLLIKAIAFPETSGAATLFVIVLSLILVFIAVAPCLLEFYESKLLYNEAANCNASGNAALIEIARQLGTGAYNMDKDQMGSQNSSTPYIHGQQAVQSAGLVPEDAKLNYDSNVVPQASVSSDPLVEREQTLANAKAAVAAFTAPRKPRTQYDDEGNIVQDIKSASEIAKTEDKKDDYKNIVIDDATAARAAIDTGKAADIPNYMQDKKPEVPSWFKSAQSKAQKQDETSKEQIKGQRSRFAHTMDVMQAKKAFEEEEKRKAEEAEREKLRQKIIAANKQAEEERNKKIGEEKPFFRNAEVQNAQAQQTAAPSQPQAASVQQSSSVQQVAVPQVEAPMQQEVVSAQQQVSTPQQDAPTQSQQAATVQEVSAQKNLSIDESFKKNQLGVDNNKNATPSSGTASSDKTISQAPVQAEIQEAMPVPNIPETNTPVSQVVAQEQATAVVNQDQNGQAEAVVVEQSETVVTQTAQAQQPTIEEPPAIIGFAPDQEDVNSAGDNAETPQNLVEAASEATTAMPPVQPSQPIVRPDNSAPIDMGQSQQYAPLADQNFISSNDMPENSSMIELPEVFTKTDDIENDPQYAEALKQGTGPIDSVDVERGKFGTGSFAAVSESEGVAGATGTFAPVTEELIEDASKSGQFDKVDIVVDDADDSVYSEGQFTDTGAFAGRDYVEMPKEKRGGLFRLFGKKKGPKHSNKDNIASSQDESFGVDEDWNGGAFSVLDRTLNSLKRNKNEQPQNDNVAQSEDFDQQQHDSFDYGQQAQNDKKEYRDDLPITDENYRITSMMDAVPDFDGQIQEFHNTSINMEV